MFGLSQLSESDSELTELHCIQTSTRMDAYQSNMATQHGLINLGRDIGIIEQKKILSGKVYSEILKSIPTLENFDSKTLYIEIINTNDTVLRNAKIQSLIYLIETVKKLHQHHVASIKYYKKELKLSIDEKSSIDEMNTSYINEIENLESEYRCVQIKLKNKEEIIEKEKLKVERLSICCFIIIGILILFT